MKAQRRGVIVVQEEDLAGEVPVPGGTEPQDPEKEKREDPVEGNDSDQKPEDEMNKAPAIDPETMLEFEPDRAFDSHVGTAKLPPAQKIWEVMGSMRVPTINTDETPSPITVLQFVFDMEKYRGTDDEVRAAILTYAFQGREGGQWCTLFDYDFDKLMNKLLNRMMWSREWIDLKAKWEKSEKLARDLPTHIHYFKLIAKYMGVRAESERTKRIFVNSVGSGVLPNATALDYNGRYKSFKTLEQVALTSKARFDDSSETSEKVAHTEEVAAASAEAAPKEGHGKVNASEEGKEEAAAIGYGKGVKRPHKEESWKSNRPFNGLCYFCGKKGHFTQNCRLRARFLETQKKEEQKKRNRKAPSSDWEDEACVVGTGMPRKLCRIGKELFWIGFDSGASINIITKDAARRLRGSRIEVDKEVRTVGGKVQIKEALETTINWNNRQARIRLHIVDDAPADILLGTPFLERFSEGFRTMVHEFCPTMEDEVNSSVVCCARYSHELEALLDKYPKLVLEEDELPDPSRFYRGRSFELGIPENQRHRTYFRAQYPPNPQQIELFRKFLEPLIRAGVYKESTSRHNNPVMLVPKKKPGQYRLVVDNRLVNAVCKPVGSISASPLAIIRMTNGAKIFTTLDCKNAFYSLVLTKRDREFTAISPPGMPRLELTRMPMGARASMSALCQAMGNTLGDALYRYALVWADDVIIFSKSMAEHVAHVDDILRRLDANGFCISRSKAELGKTSIKWLGYTISAQGVRPDKEKVDQLLSMRRPYTLKELRSAIGMWTYFSSFIPRYSIIAAPLMSQLKKENVTLVWSKDCENAWQEIKRRLASPPIMAFANYSQPLFLHTDACKMGFAAILTQRRDNRHVLVDATSRTTTPAEKNYSSAKLECACVIWAAKKWKHYLYAVPMTIIVTDSYGLQYLQQKGSESALVQRWVYEMEGFKYTVRYRKGEENIADFLSRQGDVLTATGAVHTRSTMKNVEVDFEALNQRKWKRRMSPTVDAETAGSRPEAKRARAMTESEEEDPAGMEIPSKIRELIEKQNRDSNIQRLWLIANHEGVYQPSRQEEEDAENLSKTKGVIVKEVARDTGSKIRRIVVPLEMQRKVTEEAHELSHAGVRGTYAVLQQRHWFRGMKASVKEVVRSCPICMASRGRTLSKEKMHPDQRPIALGGRWHVDGLQLPQSGIYDHLMVAVDAATKYVILRPARGETAEAAANILMDIVRRFGRPREVTTDRGRAFMSTLFMKVCERMMITFKPVGVGQPQADGMVERVNRTLIHVATTMCKGNGRKWAQYIGEIEYALNTRVSSVTGHSPYELVYGRLPPGPVYTDDICEDPEEVKEDEQVHMLTRRINVLQQLAHENQMKAAEEQRSFHDAHAEAHSFKVGEEVWLYKPSTVAKGVTTKLAYKWAGPYIISKVHGPVTYSLMDVNGDPVPGTVHARYLCKKPRDK